MRIASLLPVALSAGLLVIPHLGADTGLLLPTGVDADKPDLLAIRTMDLDVDLVGLFARVRVTQVFENRTDRDLEGEYRFRVPDGGLVSDFALWEDGVRIPAIVIERSRGRRIYEELTAQKIDPGLVEAQDQGDSDRSAFSVKVYPIPARGTKRLELEYRMELSLVDRRARLAIPLAPTHHAEQAVGHLTMALRFRPPYPIETLETERPEVWGAVTPSGPDGYRLAFAGDDVKLVHDLAFRFRVAPAPDPIEVATHRDPRPRHAFEPFDGGRREDPFGYLLVRCLIPDRASAEPGSRGRDYLVLADLSLSMRWDRLERLVECVRGVLSGLGPEDRFSLAAFDDRAEPDWIVPQGAGGAGAVEAAMKELLARPLSGGTDLAAALRAATRWSRSPDRGGRGGAVVLLTDGAATLGETRIGELEKVPRELAEGYRLLPMAIGEGSDATGIEALARAGRGFATRIAEVGDPSFQLETFAARRDRVAVSGPTLGFTGEDAGKIEDIYPVSPRDLYPGESLRFIGRYRAPAASLTGAVSWDDQGVVRSAKVATDLPGHRLENGHLPRVWAEERIAFLLAAMDRDGEDEAKIAEIVRLARRFKLATPYTSFLAAPRALLRPRAIKPGDPVLRVKARPGIREVSARLPWGENLDLRPLRDEGVFEARFLAPPWVPEGRHPVRLYLRSGAGERFVVEETMVLDGTAPTVRLVADPGPLVAGSRLALRVFADQDTRHLSARLEGGAPVVLRYRSGGHFSEAELPIPELPRGRVRLVVEAEDHAHNRSSTVFELEVAG